MRLPLNTVISPSRLTDYLLVRKLRNDKSQWLARVGYRADNWQRLESDLRQQVLPLVASLDESSRYGDVYRIETDITGPNGRTLQIVTVWIIEHATNQSKFITMYPKRGGGG